MITEYKIFENKILSKTPTEYLDERMDEILKDWRDYYGSEEKADDEFSEYKWEVDRLYKEGGQVYRIFFLNDASEINKKNLGSHWTTSEWNANGIVESLWDHYGKDKKYAFMIKATTPPYNIDIEYVDLCGNPNEKEINIIDDSKLSNLKIYKYDSKQFIEI